MKAFVVFPVMIDDDLVPIPNSRVRMVQIPEFNLVVIDYIRGIKREIKIIKNSTFGASAEAQVRIPRIRLAGPNLNPPKEVDLPADLIWLSVETLRNQEALIMCCAQWTEIFDLAERS